MAKTNFENAKSFLKAHPGAQLTTHRRGRQAESDAALTESPVPSPDLDRHRRKCQLCHHPGRREIEADYLRWRSTAEIAKEFGIADHSAICRHARATGLRNERQRRIAYALEPILEQSEDVFLKTSASNIINAVRTYSQINDEGRRLRSKPVTHIYITNETGAAPLNPEDLQWIPGLKHLSRHSSLACPEPGRRAPRHCRSNRPIQELEVDSTH